jgi:hypothetical protein
MEHGTRFAVETIKHGTRFAVETIKHSPAWTESPSPSTNGTNGVPYYRYYEVWILVLDTN